ncbi:MAG: aminoglycoside phosphotransferase [Gaiellaceae bacterium]|jgi:streptomycin 6-kinase|nr:aminoglycoside phosphotransferase [Gaiellaceae bacterium]
MRIPQALADVWQHEPEWLTVLPRLAEECAQQWAIRLEQPVDTPYSLVVPAGDVVLKLHAPSDVEAHFEADALATWAGNGAARLIARDEARHALLLERCVPGTRLWDAEADEAPVVSELIPRLQLEVAGDHRFPLLATEAGRWDAELPKWYAAGGRPFEKRILEHALDVYRTIDRSASVLVNQDLHGANILAAEREAWLVIDPKPLVGERELEASGLLRNTHDVSRWLDVLVELGFDRERARGWGVAHNLAWAWDERRGWLEQHVEEVRRILNAR